jgi:hypothetical protein
VESSWSRAWRDFKNHFNRQGYGLALGAVVLGALVFWIARGTESAEEQIAGWILSGLAPLVVLLAVTLVWQLFRAPYRQRDESRQEAEKLQAALTKSFPDMEIEVEDGFVVPLVEQKSSVALVFDLRVTNREQAARVNLTFDLALVWTHGHGEPLRSRLFTTREKTHRAYEDKLLPSIVELDGGTTKTGFLSFDHYSTDLATDHWIDFKEWGASEEGLPLRFSAKERHHFLLIVRDFVSGQFAEFEVPGTWTRVASADVSALSTRGDQQ